MKEVVLNARLHPTIIHAGSFYTICILFAKETVVYSRIQVLAI